MLRGVPVASSARTRPWRRRHGVRSTRRSTATYGQKMGSEDGRVSDRMMSAHMAAWLRCAGAAVNRRLDFNDIVITPRQRGAFSQSVECVAAYRISTKAAICSSLSSLSSRPFRLVIPLSASRRSKHGDRKLWKRGRVVVTVYDAIVVSVTWHDGRWRHVAAAVGLIINLLARELIVRWGVGCCRLRGEWLT